MKIRLMIAVDADRDGRTCRDKTEYDGCAFNAAGICGMFVRPDSTDADPPPDEYWRSIRLGTEKGRALRCQECLDAAAAAAE